MKATGIVRPIVAGGRVVLPAELRREMELEKHTPMEYMLMGRAIVLRKYQAGCLFCGGLEEIMSVRGKHVCRSCAKKIIHLWDAYASEEPQPNP